MPLPEPNMTPTPLELCEDGLGTGTASFDLTQAESNLSNFSSYTYTYYVSETGAHNGPGDVSQVQTPKDFLSPTGPIWVRVENSFTDTPQQCYVVVRLELVVNPWPTVGPMTKLVACMDKPAETFKFNLHDKDAEALAGANPADFTVKYYLSEDDAEANTNPIPYVFTNTAVSTDPINKKYGFV